MTLSPALRKLVLTLHIVSTVGWLGGLGVFLALMVAGQSSGDDGTTRAVYVAAGLAAWWVILPLSAASLATGLVQTWGTHWGLARHYWVLAKLLLTAIGFVVLLMKLGPIRELAEAAASGRPLGGDLAELGASLTFHAGGGLLILLAATVLSVYKPWGLTAYGARWRHRMDGAPATETGATAVPTPGPVARRRPRWALIIGVHVAVLALAFVVQHIAKGGMGGH